MKRSVTFALALLSLAGCTKTPSRHAEPDAGPSPQPSVVSAVPVVVAEAVYDGALKNKWEDLGWAKRQVKGPGPARVDFSKRAGWTIAKPTLVHEGGHFGGVSFRVKLPAREVNFLELRVETTDASMFPRVKIFPDSARDVGGGWSEVVVPMGALDPEGVPFDRIVLRAFRDVPPGWVELDKISLLAVGPETAAATGGASVSASRTVTLNVDCRAAATPIDPRIYGIGYDIMRGVNDPSAWSFGATARRWGGNPTSRYNWELGNAWNTANDWYFENVNIPPYTEFLKGNAEHHAKTALTVPTIGWVAKDTTSYSFPSTQFHSQQAMDPERPGRGNGNGPDGKPLTPLSPTVTSIAAPPEFVGKWVDTIRKSDAEAGTRSIDQYILDNEPGLWNSTHRDVHPDPLTYDELLEKTIAYGTAIRAADPDAVIAGPASWGWQEYQYSAKDVAVSVALRPDRRAHGDIPLLPWWLGKLREHEQKTGMRLIDLVDVHFYPQSVKVFDDSTEDERTAALRIRSTRALWDPSYKDESWIADNIMLLPRLKKWIAENYPGRGMSIGEYNFGGENRMSGALAEAEVLGRFAQHRVSSAFFWTYPKVGSPIREAFRAYRDFDGKGGRFLDFFLTSNVSPATDATSIFASRDRAGNHLVVVLLNLAADSAAHTSLHLDGCGLVQSQTAYTYSSGLPALAPVKERTDAGAPLEQTLAPYSITVLDLQLQTPVPGALEK